MACAVGNAAAGDGGMAHEVGANGVSALDVAATIGFGEFQKLVDELCDAVGVFLNAVAQFQALLLGQLVALYAHDLREA